MTTLLLLFLHLFSLPSWIDAQPLRRHYPTERQTLNNDYDTFKANRNDNRSFKRSVHCPRIGRQEASTTVETNNFGGRRTAELSGVSFSLALSTPDTGDPIFYAMGDGGTGPLLGIWNGRTGQLLRQLRVGSGITNIDWESMALGSCGTFPASQDSCLYIADFGDNKARGSNGKISKRGGIYRILKLPEPRLEIYTNHNDEVPVLQTLYYDYSHPSSPTPNADAEAMFLDHTGWGDDERYPTAPGDLYILTKWDTSDSLIWNRLFRIPADVWGGYNSESTRYAPEALESINSMYSTSKTPPSVMGYRWTRADMSPDGTVIALGADEITTLMFLRCPGASIAEVFLSEDYDYQMETACGSFDLTTEGSVESLGFGTDGTAILQFAEGDLPMMQWTELVFENFEENETPTAAETCPIPRYFNGVCKASRDSKALPNAWCDAALMYYQWDATMILSANEAPPIIGGSLEAPTSVMLPAAVSYSLNTTTNTSSYP